MSIYTDIDEMDNYYVSLHLTCEWRGLMYQVKCPSYRYGRSYIDHNPQTTNLDIPPEFLPLHPPRPSDRSITGINEED